MNEPLQILCRACGRSCTIRLEAVLRLCQECAGDLSRARAMLVSKRLYVLMAELDAEVKFEKVLAAQPAADQLLYAAVQHARSSQAANSPAYATRLQQREAERRAGKDGLARILRAEAVRNQAQLACCRQVAILDDCLDDVIEAMGGATWAIPEMVRRQEQKYLARAATLPRWQNGGWVDGEVALRPTG